MNIFEKILARASRKKIVEPNEIVEASIDMAMIHDLTGPLTVDSFRKIGVKRVWNPERIVTIFDHLIPASTIRAASLQKTIREFVAEQNIKNFYDIGYGGICHQVFHERGHARPGELIVGADSHTCTYGALGAFATGIGSTEMAAVLATGKMWFKVPKAIKIQTDGKFRDLVTPKDLILHVIGEIGEGGATYMGMEFVGTTIDAISVDGRLTICNMAVEAGAKTGIVPADHKTIEYVKKRTNEPFVPIKSDDDDDDAIYERILDIDAGSISPQIACPNSVDNVKPVSEVETEINQVFIGSCTNGRMEDLRLAANILKGKKIKPSVRMIVTPASQDVYIRAMKEGLLEIFVNSGGVVTNATCGPCLGGHLGLLSAGEVCLSTSNRNFIGRMGSPESKVYLASPSTAAASALAVKIVDPTI
jgi:3-isopropylmalate/(R)-2-methylmalate dehydratase large subunit